MKTLFFAAAALALAASPAAAKSVYVHGYTTKNGTYVAPHYRSSPDSSRYNNWSTTGNVNPYTGKVGTTNPYGSSSYYQSPTYSSPYGSSSTYQSPTYSSPYGSSSTYQSPTYSSPYGSSSYGSSNDSDDSDSDDSGGSDDE